MTAPHIAYWERGVWRPWCEVESAPERPVTAGPAPDEVCADCLELAVAEMLECEEALR